MSKYTDKVKAEFRELVPITIFFFLALQMLALTQSLMLRTYGIPVHSFLEAALGALVIAKVVAVADHIPFINLYPQRPLAYNVVWKTLIYFAASFVVRYAEKLFHTWREVGGSFADANTALLDRIVWPHFWCVQMWLLVLLALCCSVRELARALGHGRVVRMFFRDPPPKKFATEGGGAG
ncbi:MAG: hypothetical protein ACREJO_12330 [Phycisphaerales bacterium]